MGKTFKGDTLGKGLRIGIAVSRFNESVTSRLLDGALEGLNANGVSQYAIDVAWTPGALELPIVARQMAGSGRYDAIICLGAVIRGETAHFDYVSAGAQQGVVKASLDTGVPILFGVLTTDDTSPGHGTLRRQEGQQGLRRLRRRHRDG